MPGKNKEDVIYATYECMEDGPTRDALEEYVAQNPVDGLHQPICPERFDYKPRGYNLMQDYHHFLQLRYKRQYHLTHITSNHAESSAPCAGASSEAPFSC